jgi:hypothetical protein
MTGRKSEPFKIYEISDGEPKVFAVELIGAFTDGYAVS